MRGRELTRPTNDLGLIFWHIRTSRVTNTRRSWQRRARQALAKRDDLTPAERHEVMCTWSREDCHMVRSPAMAKLLGQPINTNYQHKPPTLRARFESNGQKPDVKKPGQTRLHYGDAANDAIAYSPDKRQRSQRPCIHALASVRALSLSLSRPRSYQPRHAHAPGDSGNPSVLAYGNPLRSHAPPWPMPSTTTDTSNPTSMYAYKPFIKLRLQL
jgi:hypothetical protein